MTGDESSSSSPPRNGRFQKGKSGNPAGRPKSKPKMPASVFDVILDRPRIVRNGVEQEVTLEEALQLTVYRNAIAGKARACRQVLRWILKRELARSETARRAGQKRSVSVKVYEEPENANEALLLLEIAKMRGFHGLPDVQRLFLEPWAVQQALSRRRRQRFTDREIAEVRRCTYEASTLHWPVATED